ncbi:MAG: BrnT family toxin [bacterium]
MLGDHGMGYLFDWDPKKAAANARKHGVTFEEASTVFGDPLSLLLPDPDHSLEEERYLVLGMSRRRRLLVVAFSERPPLTRLITAREASRHERRRYEKEN